MSANREGAPAALLANLKYNHVLHERVLLLNVQYEEVPYIDRDQRIEVEHLGHQIYRATFRYGFMEEAERAAHAAARHPAGQAVRAGQRAVLCQPHQGDSHPTSRAWRPGASTCTPSCAATPPVRPTSSACRPARVFEIGTTIEM